MRIKHAIVVAKLHPREAWHYPRLPHRRVLKQVCQALKKRKLTFQVIDRKDLPKTFKTRLRGDLLITVGGDGTVLTSSHYAGDIPILGVNSSPKTSTGFFCLAFPKTFGKILDAILAKHLEPKKIPRLKIRVGRKEVPFFVLN